MKGEGGGSAGGVASASLAARIACVAGEVLERIVEADVFDRYCRELADLAGAEVVALVVAGDDGELRTRTVHVRAGAAIDIDGAAQWPLARLAELPQRWSGGRAAPLPEGAWTQVTPLSAAPEGPGFQVVARRESAFAASEVEICQRLGEVVAAAIRCADGIRRLESDVVEKSGFLRTVSHELRTPLDSVIGYADLVVEGAFGEPVEEHRKILRRVGDRARGLVEVIAATLDLSGVDKGHAGLDERAVPLSDFLHDLREDVREWSRRGGVDLKWNIPNGLPVIHTDASKLRIVLRNLIDNAIKFTEEGEIAVLARENDDGVEVSVADSGIGLDEQAIAYVFDAFRQAPAGKKGGGIGLGLYIARRLVGMLNGRLWAESQTAGGAKFYVWLPVGGEQGDKALPEMPARR